MNNRDRTEPSLKHDATNGRKTQKGLHQELGLDIGMALMLSLSAQQGDLFEHWQQHSHDAAEQVNV
jgi:hypothetical protein